MEDHLVFVVSGEPDHGSWDVAPGGGSEDGRERAIGRVLREVADTDDRAAEFVGERVEAADRVADEPFLVGVDAAEVVADRVEDDEADLADRRGEVAGPSRCLRGA